MQQKYVIVSDEHIISVVSDELRLYKDNSNLLLQICWQSVEKCLFLHDLEHWPLAPKETSHKSNLASCYIPC